MNDEKLVEAAINARGYSKSPLTSFAVGAALLTSDDEIFCGQNQENSILASSLCAERVAFASAISVGKQKFKAIAIVGDGEDYCYPCGICRQVMAEYCEDDFIIIAVKNRERYRITTLGELLPHAFRLEKK